MIFTGIKSLSSSAFALSIAGLVVVTGAGCKSTQPAETTETKAGEVPTVGDAVEACIKSVPENSSVRDLLSFARERQILQNRLNPAACRLYVVNHKQLDKGIKGTFSGTFESIETMELEASRKEFAAKGSLPPEWSFQSNINWVQRDGVNKDSPNCAIKLIHNASSNKIYSRSVLGFSFYVKPADVDPSGSIPLHSDSFMTSRYVTESFVRPIGSMKLVSDKAVNGHKYFIAFDREDKITSFGLLTQSGLRQEIKWECKLNS